MSTPAIEEAMLRAFMREAYKRKRKPGYAFYQFKGIFGKSPNPDR